MNKNSSLISLVVILIAAFALFSFETGNYPLIGVDEPRYAETAREILESGNWILPQCHYEPRYDKPILYYWLEAFSMSAFGLNEFAARLPSVLAGLGMIVLAYLLGNIQNFGLISALILASSLEIWLASRLSITDIVLCFFISATISFFFLGYVRQDSYRRKFAFKRKSSSNWFIAMFVMAALGMLTKGPVAVLLPLLVILPFLLYSKDLMRCLQDARQEMLLGSLAFILISAPWYIAVHIASQGAFSYEFFWRHNIERYTSVVSNHHGPFWFYIPVILLGFFPWTAILFPALRSGLQDGSTSQLASRLNTKHLLKFCLWWALIVFLFFSISSTKLVTYILPIYLPLSIISASWWSQSFNYERTQPWRNLHGLIGLGFTLVVLLIGAFIASTAYRPQLLELSHDAFALAFLLIAFILLAGFCIAMSAILREAEISFITISITAILIYLTLTLLFVRPYAFYMDDGLKSFVQKNPKSTIYSLESPLTSLFFYGRKNNPALKSHEVKSKLKQGEEFYLVLKPRQGEALSKSLTLVQAGKRFRIYHSPLQNNNGSASISDSSKTMLIQL